MAHRPRDRSTFNRQIVSGKSVNVEVNSIEAFPSGAGNVVDVYMVKQAQCFDNVIMRIKQSTCCII